jgi:hypothetical protein
MTEAVLHTEYLNITRDPEMADLHLSGLRAAQAFPAVNMGELK